MCFSFLNLIKGIRELKNTLHDTKENLSDIKSILEGALKITEDIERVTEQIDSVVEFYSKESKKALRDQLSTTMTLEGREKLSHKDFMTAYKGAFENEILHIIEGNHSKQARIIILNIIKQQNRYIIDLNSKLEPNTFKCFTLSELLKYLNESASLYNRGHCNMDINEDIPLNETANSIKVFCDKQRIISKLEDLLNNYCLAESEEMSYQTEAEPLRFRERSTRIRKFRQYLKSRIKLKKIGTIYKEEINVQVNIDFKKISEQIWDIEKTLDSQCSGFIEVLKQLPRQRFIDVINEECTFNISDLFQDIRLGAKDVFKEGDVTFIPEYESSINEFNENQYPETTKADIENFFETRKNKHSSLEHVRRVTQRKRIQNKLTILSDIPEDGDHEVETENLQFVNSADITYEDDSNCRKEEAIIISANCKKESHMHISSVAEPHPYDSLETKKEKVMYRVDTSSLTDNEDILRPTIFNKTVVIDPGLIYNDMERMMLPIFDILGEKSFRYAMQSIDDSHILISRIIDITANIEQFINSQPSAEGGKNIFIDKFIDVCTIDMNEDGKVAIKKLTQTILSSKEKRKYFYKTIENKLPSIMNNVVKNCAGIIKEIKYKKYD